MNVSKLEMENERSEAALACSGSGLDKLWFRIWNHNFFTDQEIKVVVWNTGEMFHALQKRQNSLRQVQIKKKKRMKASGLEYRCIGVRFPELALKWFLFATVSRRKEGPTQSLVCWARKTLYPEIKQSEHKANEMSCTSTRLRVILAR